MLLENRDHYLIPGDRVAHVEENNPLTHAFLVLTKVRYSKIPVLAHDSTFVGLLSMPMITETMLGLDELSFAPLDQLTVKDVMQTDVTTIQDPYDVENVLHLLVDKPFLPVVAENSDFTGIVTRREMMKSVNHLVHNIDKEYDLIERMPEKEAAQPVTTEVAAGAIIYRERNGQRQYLLVDSKDRHFWGFAKGHVEGDETFSETARREIHEETGLRVQLNTHFTTETEYQLPNGHLKQVHLCLSRIDGDPEMTQQESEISAIRWFSYSEALQVLKFKNLQEMLTQANDYLKQA
ncbi:CBS domain containing protein [Lactobacillus selangorensis]|uniref:Bis(5'-nucleosyl)-tetraphosphatase [asymmetrical] n=2 Tax=Lactobacillus selangorensis TaxID=81857 RepID=A0A0R2FII3_9LACO|nr:CBS domain containing protein [Lactobacillus selangorensis]KRN31336.1 CBS domain containing protein [Lactobacillus selangorensis]